ncbi:LPS export ABC transporter periplasmic protein LptC [Microvirga sp. W0021]|uniref:LPS export ABC transporter periplasmic protein LptC n=1 Tax=Hohaiivirga grylli TaxID=3133970 RepID=A0ABV0BGL4_9HYPH
MNVEMAIDGAKAEANGVAKREPRTRAYSDAQRHTKFVKVLKKAIPIGSILAIVLMIGFAYFDPFRNIDGLTVGPVTLNGTQITMQSPKLTGFRKDGRPYEMIASAATQDAKEPTLVELKDLRGKVSLDEKGGLAHLKADIGHFDTQKENLHIKDNVSVKTENGQQVYLKSASIDFKTGKVVSTEPVSVRLQSGTIDAQGLEVLDNGRVLVFTGRVHSVFEKFPDEDETKTVEETGTVNTHSETE